MEKSYLIEYGFSDSQAEELLKNKKLTCPHGIYTITENSKLELVYFKGGASI